MFIIYERNEYSNDITWLKFKQFWHVVEISLSRCLIRGYFFNRINQKSCISHYWTRRGRTCHTSVCRLILWKKNYQMNATDILGQKRVKSFYLKIKILSCTTENNMEWHSKNFVSIGYYAEGNGSFTTRYLMSLVKKRPNIRWKDLFHSWNGFIII